MKLINIAAKGLQGPEFDHNLTNAIAIIGPNFSGKTRISTAIRVLFKGYAPELGKQNSSTFELASNGVMSVTGKFDNGQTLLRTFRDDKGVIRSEVTHSISTSDLVALTQAPLLDPDVYFGMTAREQIDYVFAMVPLGDSYTPDAVIAELEQISFELAHTEAHQTAKREIISLVTKHLGPKEAKKKLQDGLIDALAELKDKFTYWNKRSRETIGTVATLTELKLQENESGGETVETLKSAIGTAQARLDAANAGLGTLTARREQAQANDARRKVLEAELAAASPDYDGQLAEKEKAIAELRGQIVKITGDSIKANTDKLQDLRLDQARAIQQATILDGVVKELEGREKELASLEQCPYCQSAEKGWKKHVRKTLADALSTNKEKLDEANKKVAQLRSDVKEAEKRVSLDNEVVAHNRTLSEQIGALELRVRELNTAKSSRESRVAQFQKELEELRKASISLPTEEEVIRAGEERSAAQTELKALNERKDKAARLAQDLQRAAQAELEHLKAKAYANTIKAVQEALTTIREGMVEKVFGTLLSTAQSLVGDILKTPLAFHQGAVGRWEGSKFISRTFSGTEKALIYSAVALALSVRSPIKLVILDEFGRLDGDNKRKFIIRLCELVQQHVIDQFIVIGTDPLPAFPDQPEYLLQVINTGQ